MVDAIEWGSSRARARDPIWTARFFLVSFLLGPVACRDWFEDAWNRLNLARPLVGAAWSRPTRRS